MQPSYLDGKSNVTVHYEVSFGNMLLTVELLTYSFFIFTVFFTALFYEFITRENFQNSFLFFLKFLLVFMVLPWIQHTKQ